MKVKIVEVPLEQKQAEKVLNEALSTIEGSIVNEVMIDSRRIAVFYNEKVVSGSVVVGDGDNVVSGEGSGVIGD